MPSVPRATKDPFPWHLTDTPIARNLGPGPRTGHPTAGATRHPAAEETGTRHLALHPAGGAPPTTVAKSIFATGMAMPQRTDAPAVHAVRSMVLAWVNDVNNSPSATRLGAEHAAVEVGMNGVGG